MIGVATLIFATGGAPACHFCRHSISDLPNWHALIV